MAEAAASVVVRRALPRDAAAVEELLASSPLPLTLALASGGASPAPAAACIERGVVSLVAEERRGGGGGGGGGAARLVGFAAAADRLSESDAHAIDALLADVQSCVVDAVVSVSRLEDRFVSCSPPTPGGCCLGRFSPARHAPRALRWAGAAVRLGGFAQLLTRTPAPPVFLSPRNRLATRSC